MKEKPEHTVVHVRSRILQYRDEAGIMEFAYDVGFNHRPWAVEIPRGEADGKRLDIAIEAVTAYLKSSGIDEVEFYRPGPKG